MKKLEEVVELYKKFCKFPQAASAAISSTVAGDYNVINTVQTQRDLERSEKVKFTKTYCVKIQDGVGLQCMYQSTPQEIANEIWNKPSPSGKYKAIVRCVEDKKKDEKQYLEVWDGTHKVYNYEVQTSEKHGKIYDPDGYFGTLEWSSQEDRILYVAEKKYKKAVSYFAKSSEEEEKEKKPLQGEEYVVKEEWGEGLVGKHHPVLCIITIATGEVTVVDGVPEDVSPGLARWTPADEGIVFTGWQHEPYRLGLIYCIMRKSTLFHLKLSDSSCETLSCEDKASRCCAFSPDRSCFVYLENHIGGPHGQCCRLLKYNWETRTRDTLIEEVNIPAAGQFPGLYALGLPNQCWSMDGKRVVINSTWRSELVGLVVNTDTCTVTRLPADNGCSLQVLCTKNDVIVAQCASPKRPHYLVVGRLSAAGQEHTIQWFPLETESETVENVSWKVVQHQPTPDRVNTKYPSLDYESILVYPSNVEADPSTRTLVVFPHGGPHSVFTTDYMMYVTLLCKLGFSSLLVNYRGSTGFGWDNINSLLGNIGDQDVKDVQEAALQVIDSEGYNKEKVVVWGGSHGGFLTCHLIGQYPGFYKAAVCRNPVIDLPTKHGPSDIPDVNFTECGLTFEYKSIPSVEMLSKMWSCSPLQYVDQVSSDSVDLDQMIQTPTMLMIGQDDLRVPPKQSKELYKALKARNVPVRYIAYPGNGHPIIKVDSEADAFINIYKWFTDYLPQ